MFTWLTPLNYPSDSRGVLASLRVQLQLDVDEEGGKYTKVTAKVYLPYITPSQHFCGVGQVNIPSSSTYD